MGLAVPAILFTWVILFGSQSYQEWVDRFQYELTNRYLFSQLTADSVLDPLWRDDVLSGNVWAVSIGPKPPALVLVLGRTFHLSPLWLDLIGNLTLYFVATVSMYVYLRCVLFCCVESAAATAMMFAATSYWIAMWVENPELPMAVAWLPALLTMAHQIERSTEQKRGPRLLLSIVGLSLIFYGCAVHSVLVSLPIAGALVLAYAWFVFGLSCSVLWIVVALGIGALLYAPFLWAIVEAVRISRRGVEAAFTTLNSQDPWSPVIWLANGVAVLSRMAVGHNQYGFYLVVVLIIVVWGCIGPSMSREQPRVRKILQVAIVATWVMFAIEIFSEAIDYLKRSIPLLGGWHVARFQHFSFLPLFMVVGWMLDRSLYCPREEPINPARSTALRWGVIATGILGCVQVAYSAYRMRLVPATICPQNLILYVYLILYAAVTGTLLLLLFRLTQRPSVPFRLLRTDMERVGVLLLIVLSVSLTVSAHTYRPGVLPPRVGVALEADPIMTYAQRYSVPDEIMAIKRLNQRDGRVVDLTRPWYPDGLGPASESVLYPLAGVRTTSGYNLAYPYWYERFINIGINGRPSRARYVVQVEDTGATNFEALGLLDVHFILTDQRAQFPGYMPVTDFRSNGKVLYGAEDGSQIGPAFISPEFRCFASDNEALDFIHRSGLRALRAQAVLVAPDMEASPLCAGKYRVHSVDQEKSPQIHVHRGQDRIRIEVEHGFEGILTLADTYYPGWKVFVNGIERPLLRTYTTLRGVVIEPGRQVVEFVYAPWIFNLLYRLSNGVLACLLLTALVAWGMDRASRQDVGTYEVGK